jgi:hypothetical protein
VNESGEAFKRALGQARIEEAGGTGATRTVERTTSGGLMLTYLEALAIGLAAVMNGVIAYQVRDDRWKARLLAACAAFLALVAVHTVWPFY